MKTTSEKRIDVKERGRASWRVNMNAGGIRKSRESVLSSLHIEETLLYSMGSSSNHFSLSNVVARDENS